MKLFKNVYSDIPMFFSKNSFTGDVNLKKDSNAIKESIKNLILTMNYERPFDAEFGTPAANGLFENQYDYNFLINHILQLKYLYLEMIINFLIFYLLLKLYSLYTLRCPKQILKIVLCRPIPVHPKLIFFYYKSH